MSRRAKPSSPKYPEPIGVQTLEGEELKAGLIKSLEVISGYYKGMGKEHEWRYSAYLKASTNLKAWQGPIISGAQLHADVAGVGESLADDIDQYLRTGKMGRLEHLRQEHPESVIIDYFDQIYDIGPEKARTFYELGFTSFHDLITKAKLTDAQKKGIYWRSHMGHRIPRDEMNEIYKLLIAIFQPYHITFEMVGSYRRLKPSSGDVDIIVRRDNYDITIKALIALLTPVLAVIFAQGDSVARGMIQIDPKKYLAHRIDINLFEPAEYAYRLMHSTGSDIFNQLMRLRAKEFGWKLNEKGLYNAQGQLYPASTEQDIFNALRVTYLTPEQRENPGVLPTY
jgi:DNA polymerase/3'-5' exonuclease PolX